MIGRWLNMLTGRSNIRSKNIAKERLLLVLSQDRSSLSPELLNTLKEEIVMVISKYVDIDQDAMEFQLGHQGNSPTLIASIPVRRAPGAGGRGRVRS